jgi:hypothetical protein
MTAFVMHYDSISHGSKQNPPVPFMTRYFVGIGHEPCELHGYHVKPTWTYEKDEANILEDEAEASKAKEFAEGCGYTGLVLTPIDEEKPKLPSTGTIKPAPTPEVV